jgi:hypothetical protein
MHVVVTGTVKTLQVDDSQIVANLMVVICTKIGITNYDEYGLVSTYQSINVPTVGPSWVNAGYNPPDIISFIVPGTHELQRDLAFVRVPCNSYMLLIPWYFYIVSTSSSSVSGTK